MFFCLQIVLAFALLSVVSWAQFHPSEPAKYQRLPSLRDQARILDEWKDERVARIPQLLERYGVDAWLMSQREHAEDPIWWSIKNATDFAAHRRTVVLFLANPLPQQTNPVVWVDNTGKVWGELLDILEASDPQKIVLNVDHNIAFSGGLHVGEFEVLQAELGSKWKERFVNQPMIGIEYVATRVRSQLEYYRMLQETTWAMIAEAFSEAVIKPEITTTENHPRVSVVTPESFPGWQGTQDVIQEGDILHVDYGITAMGMNTDVQHMAYVLRAGETDAPQGLKDGIRKANRMQDIILSEMRAGRSGNAVLQGSLAQMKVEGLEGQIYCHPIGDYGHAPGAVMGSPAGFTNLPVNVPVLGDLPLLPETYYSIELYAYSFVPERNETLRFRLEENAYWVDEERGWEFVYGRQEMLHLVGKTPPSLLLQN
ncbi:hypothetical protein JAAARDRAFT_52322 [Jaapia argillacea MUCL 33604]|uniref:Uncharacterized protein n=1 Tax=Jaapia argillacea MUCL 33604 TaxID=933084 RepID=A0A067QBL4_9AGAM|nr:hypothetical protein JAAARDRAFT_52322 [Jaapia argillacea MUCL 33604]